MKSAKIALFSKHLHWLQWDYMIDTVKEIGFDGIDLTVRQDGHVIPERVEEDLPRIYELCRRKGVEILMVCTDIKSANEPLTEKIVRTLSKLGISQYRMGWHFYYDNKNIKENLQEITSKLNDLSELNEHYQIVGSYQNHDGTWFGASVWDLALVLNEIASPWLGSQFDILNATIEGSSSWQHVIEYIAPHIKSIDIKDATWINDNNKPMLKYMPLGNGMVDWKKFVNMIDKNKIEVPFSLHMEYDLGGADKGLKDITMPKQKILESIKNDLLYFRNVLGSY